jgi:protease-4
MKEADMEETSKADGATDAVSQATLNALLVSHLSKVNVQQEKELRWKNIRFFLMMGAVLFCAISYAVVGYFFFHQNMEDPSGDYASLVRIEGVIDASGKAAADKINPALAKAFGDKKSKGVVLLINSPGGSPVQSSMMYDRIKELRHKYPQKRVVVVAEDMLTSGAYFISSAADKIYVNRSTITGSIGVITTQFGFPKLLDRVGVERRVFTAGINKDRMDQFLPIKEEDATKIRHVLNAIHGHFIDAVLQFRKDRIKESPDKLFTGDFWTGAEAVKLGLADGLGDLQTVLKKEFNVEYTQDYTPVPGIFDRFGGILSSALKDVIVSELEGFQIR